jgi:hypothetical protein
MYILMIALYREQCNGCLFFFVLDGAPVTLYVERQWTGGWFELAIVSMFS